jgi:NADH dehydrogenase
LKTLEDATRIRHRILYAFEAAEKEIDLDKRRAWLTFVVVGAGPTGVELAGALGEIANDTLKGDFRAIRPEEARILLLDGSPRVLTPFDPGLSTKAEESLIRLGVRTLLNVKVVGVDSHGVRVHSPQGEQYIESRTILWAAGVSAADFTRRLSERTNAPIDRGGRIVVDGRCNLPGHPEIYVIGDASVLNGKDGKPLPGVAPTAMQQGSYAAKSILRRLRGENVPPFRYIDKGSLAVIGRARAVAQFAGPLRFSGLVAWLLWLFIHLMYLVTFQNRLIVFIRWAFNYLTYNRGARLITGEPEREVETHREADRHAQVPLA